MNTTIATTAAAAESGAKHALCAFSKEPIQSSSAIHIHSTCLVSCCTVFGVTFISPSQIFLWWTIKRCLVAATAAFSPLQSQQSDPTIVNDSVPTITCVAYFATECYVHPPQHIKTISFRANEWKLLLLLPLSPPLPLLLNYKKWSVDKMFSFTRS